MKKIIYWKKVIMEAKQNYWLSAIALVILSILFLYPAMSLASEGSLEDRIQVLEKALEKERLIAEHEKTMAKEVLDRSPAVDYGSRKGATIEAKDHSWALNFGGRFHYRMMFWDDKAKNESGFSQGDLALRRVRPRMSLFWEHGFYEMNFELDLIADADAVISSANAQVHFEKLNPLYPTVAIGPKVSGFFNAHDTNWGSSTGGLFDRSMFQTGAGIGAGSQNNGISLEWRRIPVGPGDMYFQAIYSNNGSTSIAKEQLPKTDKRSVHLGWQYKPFSKLKNEWIKGIDVGIGYQLDHVLPGETGRDIFRVRTTERQPLILIEVARDLKPESQRLYVTPGFGWKVGPNWLRTSYGWNEGEFAAGGNVKGRYWRVVDELFVWSPKGLFTGSETTPKSIMLFAGFERDDYEADNKGIRGGFDDAYASNLNVGMWYYVRPGLRFGVEYAKYYVDKIDRGADSLTDVKKGDNVRFDSLELAMTFDF